MIASHRRRPGFDSRPGHASPGTSKFRMEMTSVKSLHSCDPDVIWNTWTCKASVRHQTIFLASVIAVHACSCNTCTGGSQVFKKSSCLHCKQNPIYVFPLMKLRGLSFPISTFMYLWTTWEYINRSQIHECRNWERGHAVSFLGIFVSNFRYSACLCSVCTFKEDTLFLSDSYPAFFLLIATTSNKNF